MAILRKLFLGVGALVSGAFVLGLLVLLLVMVRAAGPTWLTGDRVAVIPLEGVIMSDEPFVSELKLFRDDPSVRAIVVLIDTPGGSVAASQSIYQELQRTRERGIPVVASIGSIGASGGYYAALAADSILALPGSITGSIGVIMEFPNAEELLGKVGVSMEVVKSSEHKDIGSPFRRASDTDRAVLQSMISDVYDQFLAAVIFARGLPEEEVRRLADGRLFSGRQALAAGLVDRSGNLEDAIATAGRMAGLGDDPAVVWPPPPPRSLVEVLLGVSASSMVERLNAGVTQFQGPRLRYIAH